MTAARASDVQKASMRTLGRRIWKGIVANRGLVAAVIVCGALEAALTKAPLLLVKPLLDATAAQIVEPPSDGLSLALLEFARWVCDVFGITLAEGPDRIATELLLGCAIGSLVIGPPAALATYGVLVMSRYFATKIVVDLRNEVAGHILRLPLRFFGAQRMGELISSLTTNTLSLARSFTLAADHAIVDPMLIAANVAIVLYYMPEAAWVFAIIIPIMALPMIKLGRRVQKSSHKSLAAMGDATESMTQILSGIKTVKAFQLEGRRLQEFEDNNAKFLRRSKSMFRAKATSQALVFLCYQVGFAVLLFTLGWIVLNGDHTFSELGVVIAPLATTYSHVKRLTRAYNTLLESVGALESVERILDEGVDLGQVNVGKVVSEVKGRVEMDGVSFRYQTDQAEAVLQDVSFAVEPGTSVALVGPSGAGKTTCLDLLMRFHDPASGVIRIDGHDLRDLDLKAYRRHTAVVSQQPFLFNTTILENIRCARPDATLDEVVAAAKAAQIHEHIVALPDGYESLAGERGCNLSGGQMQRITIARALLRDPAILFLDEATNALDSESEDLVQRALTNLMRGRTSFVIAHRLSTVRNADLILVMEQGRIVERGKHDELMNAGGLYQRLNQLQQLA